MFNVSIDQAKYGLIASSATIGALGIALAAASTYSTVTAITGLAVTFFSAYGILATMACSYKYRDNSEEFFKNIGSYLQIAAGAALATIILGLGKNLLDYHSWRLISPYPIYWML